MSRLKDILSNHTLSATDRFLCILADQGSPIQVKDIKATAVASGFRAAKFSNISQLLLDSGQARLVADGWEITSAGQDKLVEKGLLDKAEPLTPFVTKLLQLAPKVTNSQSAEFLKEAIGCLQDRHLRAAVVLSWIGAVSILHSVVVSGHLVAFNSEAIAQGKLKKPIKTEDDLTTLKEFDFLDLIANVSIIGKNEKKALKRCLELRNECGHPNSLKFSEVTVASHIEILLLNVFERF